MDVVNRILGRKVRDEWSKNDTQIYLAKKDERSPEKDRVYAYARGSQPTNIYIDTWKRANKWPVKQVAGIIAHEELHNVLEREQGPKASIGLDKVSIPAFERRRGGQLANPRTVNVITPKSHQQDLAMTMATAPSMEKGVRVWDITYPKTGLMHTSEKRQVWLEKARRERQ